MKTQDWAAEKNGGKYPEVLRPGEQSFDNDIVCAKTLHSGRRLVRLSKSPYVVYRDGIWQEVTEFRETDQFREPRQPEPITNPRLQAWAQRLGAKQPAQVELIRHCTRKQRHPTYEGAQRAAASGSKAYNDHLEAYKCKFCDAYHVGHPSRKGAQP